MQYGHNEILESLDLEPGKYDLKYGYHLLSELDEEFPRFYSKHCQFSLPEA